jgi:hypothetical protein
LEDVAHLDAPRGPQLSARRPGARVAVADLGGVDDPVRREIAAGDQTDDVPARLIVSGTSWVTGADQTIAGSTR